MIERLLCALGRHAELVLHYVAVDVAKEGSEVVLTEKRCRCGKRRGQTFRGNYPRPR